MQNNIGLYLTGAQLLANALAMPRQMENARKEEAVQQALLSMAGGAPFPQEQVNQAFRPPEGIAAKLTSGIGDVGAVMSSLLGSPVRPPRIDTNALMAMQKAQRESAANEELSKQFTKPQAQALARMGKYDAAVKVEQGSSAGTSELSVLIQSGRDQGMDEKAARAYGLEQLQKRQERRMGVAGGISRGNAIAGQSNADAIQDTNRRENTQEGEDLLNRYGVGTAPPTPAPTQPQSGTAVPGNAWQPMGWQPVADDVQPPMAPTPGGTVVTGGSLTSGSGTVNFGRPDPADSDMQLLARANNLDLRNLNDQQAAFLMRAKEGLTKARAESAAATARENAQIPDADRQAIVGMRTVQYLLNRALTEFTPEERAQFVGILANPMQRAAQFISPNPRFAEWMALVSQIEASKFDLAGKALTGIEQEIMERFIPTSRETGGVTDFDAKAKEYLKSSQFRVNERLNLLQGQGAVREQVEQQPIPGAPQALPTTPSGRKFRVVQ